MHSHGHSLQEIFILRHGKFEKTVDAVVYISSHDQAEKLVELAVKFNIVLIPFGGGTNVS
jgi:alkyldihydroxyacetonephosphate synthase